MRKTAFAALFAVVSIAAVNSTKVEAASLDLFKPQTNTQSQSNMTNGFEPVILLASATTNHVSQPAKPELKTHVVADGETLSAIGDIYQASWIRLFNKNTQVSDPDVLKVGDTLTIPEQDEVLADRPLPQASVIQTTSTQSASTVVASSTNSYVARGASSGNTYTAGYCTWYAKNMRPDLPNNLGNADTWVARAASQGLPTGSAPRAGAIGQQGMHVVYVERVNGDGTVFISEMNYKGVYVLSSRTANASDFRYIY